MNYSAPKLYAAEISTQMKSLSSTDVYAGDYGLSDVSSLPIQGLQSTKYNEAPEVESIDCHEAKELDSPTISAATELRMKNTEGLTFGVEFEFMVKRLKKGTEDPQPEDIRRADYSADRLVRGALYKALNNVGIHTKVCVGHRVEGLTGPGHDVWQIDKDTSLEPVTGDDQSYIYTQVEVRTRVLPFNDKSFDEIQSALDTIKSKFRTYINSTCGLHVHVGNGQKGFHQTTVQNLASLLYSFEPVLSAIHPAHRQDQSHCRSLRRWAGIVSKHPSLHTNAARPRDISNPAAIHQILNTHSIDQLKETLKSWNGDRLAYNFENLSEPPSAELFNTEPCSKQPGSKLTIEFRQHEGTLDFDRLQLWVQTVVGLVQQSHGFDLYDFDDLLRTAALSAIPDFSVSELLSLLGMQGPAKTYEGISQNANFLPDMTTPHPEDPE
jgi:hypothetical protein